MKYLITVVLVTIVFTGTSQNNSTDSVCFSLEEAKAIAQKLDKLAICEIDVQNKIALIRAYSQQTDILKPKVEALQTEVEYLTATLNDCQGNEQKLKRKRIWWGVGGVVVGALTYSYLTR